MYKIIFLDLCGTLVKENTTFDFFNKKVLPRKSFFLRLLWRSKLIQLVTKLFSICKIKCDLTKIICLYIMRGYSEAELKYLANSYIDSLSWRSDILNKIEKIVQYGYKPVIVSASLPFLVEAVSNHLMIATYVSSTMEFKNGSFTGRLLTDLQGNKVDVLANYNAEKSIFITDNLDDVLCKSVVNYFIAVTDVENLLYWKKNKVLTYVV